MVTITINNVPERLHAALKKAAASNGRSINDETLVCLKKALIGHPTDDPEAFIAQVRARQKKTAMIGLTNAQINRAKRTGRA